MPLHQITTSDGCELQVKVTGCGPTLMLLHAGGPDRHSLDAFIGHDRSFRSVDDLAAVTAPTLIFAGTDRRHPRRLAEQAATIMPRATLAATEVDATPRTPQDLADAFLPELLEFLARLPRWSADATEADR